MIALEITKIPGVRYVMHYPITFTQVVAQKAVCGALIVIKKVMQYCDNRLFKQIGTNSNY